MIPNSIDITIRKIRTTLEATFAEIDHWFDKPEALRRYKPTDGGWSIHEILEHVTLTNHYLLLLIRKGIDIAVKRAAKAERDSQVIPPDLGKLEKLADKHSLKWERPEHMAPTGEKSLSQIRQLMQEQRQHCLELLSRMESGEGTFHRIRLSVADIGKIDMYQWLYFLAQHARRHILQMERNEREWV